MRKNQVVDIIVRAAKIYDEQLNGKNLLILFGDVNKPSFIQTVATAANFIHLTGMRLNENECDSNIAFFENARDNKLKESEFDVKSGFAEQKLNVLLQTLRVASNAKMIGDYNYNASHINLQTDKLAGGVNSCMGFIKVDDYYVPNTVLETDIRKETDNRQKVLAVLSKKIKDEKYNTIEMVGKKIDIKRLLEKVSPLVEIDGKIMGDIEYNSSQIQQQQSDNIKQIKFDSPTPQNILHNGSDTAAAVLPDPNPFKNLISGLKDLFKKQDNQPVAPVQTEKQSEFVEKEIKAEENPVPPKLTELIEAREAFAEEKITMAEYKQALEIYMRSLNGKEMWTEAADNLRKQLVECPDNMKKCIDFELGSIELNIKRKFPQKQNLDDIKSAAHEQHVKLQTENKAAEKEITTAKNKSER